MRKLLWIGDAVMASGFARCTHHTLDVLRQTWDVAVLGLNYLGDPHPYPYPIFPCWPGGDAFGLNRLKPILEQTKPDLIVIQNDPWNIVEYLKRISPETTVVATMPVDGKNCRLGYDLVELAKIERPHANLELAIFWTEFGRLEALNGGLMTRTEVIPLGVDLELYKQMDLIQARTLLGLPEHLNDKFIVGNVNRNQPRKRLDLTIQYFAEWLKREKIEDAYLFLHVAPTGDAGYDVRQLKKYYDSSRDWLIVVEPPIGPGAPEALMPLVYNSFSLQVTTTQGEGWGLTTMEGMACGVPQIVPTWSALGEWTGKAAYQVPCSSTIATPNAVNAIGGVADREAFIHALNVMYHKPEVRKRMQAAGLELVSRPEFRWPAIGQRFAEVLETVVVKEKAA